MNGSIWREAAGLFGMVLALAGGVARAAEPYSVVEKSVAELQADMTAGHVTSEEIVRAYLARIEAIDRAGPDAAQRHRHQPACHRGRRAPRRRARAPAACAGRCTACRC